MSSRTAATAEEYLSDRVGYLAAYYGVREPLRLREFRVPAPAPGALLVRITRANICGTDLHAWRGDLDPHKMGRALPRAQGHEGVGLVAALGDGIGHDAVGQPLSVGDRVVFRYFFPCGRCPACLKGLSRACAEISVPLRQSCDVWPHFRGTFGDYFYLEANHAVFKVPNELPDDVVAGANCALSQVICGLELARLELGEIVVIQGAGGLGLHAVAVSRERGASRIIVLDGVPERLELAAAFGADEVIDLNSFPTPEGRIQRVRQLTGGWGGDIVLELAGLPRAVPEGIAMTARGGRYVEIGNINPGLTYVADPSDLVHSNRAILGVALYEARHLASALGFLARCRGRYPFDRLSSEAYPLDQINRAFAEQDRGHVTRASLTTS